MPSHAFAAFPSVTSVTNSGSNPSQSSLSVSVPAVSTGDRLLAFFIMAGGQGGGAAPAGWTRIYDDNQYVSVYEKIASTNENAGNVTFTQDTSSGWAAQVYLISGSHPSDASQVSSVTSVANGSSIDPPSFSPTGGAKDWLWVAIDLHGHLFGTTRTISSYPTNYTSTTPSNQTGGISQQLAGSAYRQLNTATEDPGAFTLSGAIQTGRGFTIAVPPPSSPTITTPTNANITSSGATLGGNVTSDGGSTITGRGVCVGTSANPALGGTCFAESGSSANQATSGNGATATTIDNFSGTGADAIDSNDATSWMSTSKVNATPWLRVDLGSAKTIDSFRLLEPSSGDCHIMTQYKIESSTDDSAWTTRYTSGTGLTGGNTGSVNLTSASARYWKITALAGSGSCGTQIYSFELWGASSGTTGVFTAAATGLTQNTLYHYRAYATNAIGTSYTTDDTFTTATNAPNSVTADAETNVGSYKVTLNGSANPNNLATTMYFRVFSADPGTCPADGGSGLRAPSNTGSDLDLTLTTNGITQQKTYTTRFGAPSWLTPSTNYWYCTYAVNSAGTTVSTTPQAFTTTSGAENPCDPATSGDLTITESCNFTDDNDGVDNGSGSTNTAILTVGSGANLTVNANQKVARGSLVRGSGASISLAAGASVLRGGVWIKDADGDGSIDDATRTVSSTQPAGYVRRKDFSGTYPYYSLLRAVNTFDCDSTNANIYRNVANLVTDSDNDGYKTSAAASDQCVGATSVINTRTYYKDSTGAYTRLASGSVLGGGSTDCADSGLCTDGSASSTCWTSSTYYPDSDGDSHGVASATKNGPNFAGTGASDNSIGTTSWSGPGNITASDNSQASVASFGSGTKTQYLKATNFGFNVSGTIIGIVVDVERVASVSSRVRDYSVKIVKGGTITGEERADAATNYLTTTDTFKTYGRANDLWGTTWTANDINASNFGVVVSFKNFTTATTARIDSIRITVYTGDGTSAVCGGGSPPVGYASDATDCNDADSNASNSTSSSGYTGIDADNDGQTASPISYNYCGAASSRGTTSSTDCYDSNASAYVGQTAYFTTNRGDGSFDYDCAGGATYTRDPNIVNDTGQAYSTNVSSGTTVGGCSGWKYKDSAGQCTSYANQSPTNCWGGDTYTTSATGDVTSSSTCGSIVVRKLYSNSTCTTALSPTKYRWGDSAGVPEQLGCR